MEPVQEPQVPATDNDPVNILLLGASGVGKSTFINALRNYRSYPSLDEALEGEVQCLIYSEFLHSYYDEEDILQTKMVEVGDSGDAGVSIELGASCTQRCKAYTVSYGESRVIRLIDTPGILDTRGGAVDVDNMKHILAFLAQYEVLHAVCIFLKPNEVRLTTSLKYSVVQLLEKLHKDASRNILFCFTNSRISQYMVGSTLPLLEEMLRPTREIKLNINLRKKSTMYYFDSEAFRFQAIKKKFGNFNAKPSDVADYTRSWDQSAKEAKRLIQHVLTLEPHRLKDTLSLNRVKSMLESISKSFGALSKDSDSNLQEIKRTRKIVMAGVADVSSYADRLTYEENYHAAVALDNPQTRCTRCEAICHEICSPTETVMGVIDHYEESLLKTGLQAAAYAAAGAAGAAAATTVEFSFAYIKGVIMRMTPQICNGLIGAYDPNWQLFRKLAGLQPDAVLCSQLSWSSGTCNICKCPNINHIREKTMLVPRTREVTDERIIEVLKERTSGMVQSQSILKILEDKENAMQAEKNVFMEAGARFAVFLEQNSIVTYHSAIPDHCEEEMRRMEKENNSERARELKENLKNYEGTVEAFRAFSKPGFKSESKLITEADVNEELEKLFKLSLSGPALKEWMATVESEAVLDEIKARMQG